MALFQKDDIKELRRLGFNENDVQTFQTKRIELESKLSSAANSFNDNVECIRFHKYLLKLIEEKKMKNKIKDKLDVETKIVERIKNIFKKTTQKFPNDLSIHLSFYNFCIQINSIVFAEKLLEGMLQKFGDDFKVLYAAITFYAEQRKDTVKALTFIYDSIDLHKKSGTTHKVEIIKEILKILQNFVDQSDKDILVTETRHIKCIEYYTSLLNFSILDNEQYYMDLLKFLNKHKLGEVSEKHIVDILFKHYKHVPVVWDILANRERIGLHLHLEENQRSSAKFRAESCVKMYEMGLNIVDDSKKQELWILYLDCLIDMQKDSSANQTKKALLKNAFDRAIDVENVHLPEEYHIVRLENLKLSLGKQILAKAWEQHPCSLKMWQKSLQYFMKHQSKDNIDKTFNLARISLKKESAVAIWFMMLRYYNLVCSYEEIQMLYESCLDEPKEVSDVFKPLYISWVVTVKGIGEARKIYKNISTRQPYCKQLHTMMIKLELCQIKKDYECIDFAYKMLCDQFGHDQLSVWNDYVRFCYKYGRIDRISSIEISAMNILQEDLKKDFLRSCEVLKQNLQI